MSCVMPVLLCWKSTKLSRLSCMGAYIFFCKKSWNTDFVPHGASWQSDIQDYIKPIHTTTCKSLRPGSSRPVNWPRPWFMNQPVNQPGTYVSTGRLLFPAPFLILLYIPLYTLYGRWDIIYWNSLIIYVNIHVFKFK